MPINILKGIAYEQFFVGLIFETANYMLDSEISELDEFCDVRCRFLIDSRLKIR